MGTITIKNMSTLSDKAAALIAAEYWNFKGEAENLIGTERSDAL